MAVLRAAQASVAARHEEPYTAASRPADKENRPPCKSEKTISIRGVYGQGEALKQRHPQETNTRDVLSPRFAGVTKKPLAGQGFFARVVAQAEEEKRAPQPGHSQRRAGQKLPRDQLNLDFADVARKYGDDLNSAQAETKELRRQALDDRGKGLDEDGQPLDRFFVPSKADIEALTAEIAELNTPVRRAILDDSITIETHQPDGSIKSHDHRLGDAMDAYDKQAARLRKDVAKIERALRDIEREAEDLKRDVLGQTAEAKLAGKERDEQVTALDREIEKVERQARAEIKRHRVEYDAKIAQFNRQLDRVFALAGDDAKVDADEDAGDD